jgi:hypothetical protein
MIIKDKKDVAAYLEMVVRTNEKVLECKKAYEEDESGGFKEIMDELVKVVTRQDCMKHPAYGTDWDEWFDDNVEELLEQAISIVM